MNIYNPFIEERGWLLRWLLRIPQFIRRKGTLKDRLEHLLYAEHWEYPQKCTWRVVGQPRYNSPKNCVIRTKGRSKYEL